MAELQITGSRVGPFKKNLIAEVTKYKMINK